MADETPVGAGEESAFEILGRIEVDLEALEKSLGKGEELARASAERHKKIWQEAVRPLPGGGFSEGGPGGEGPGGGGGEGGPRHSPTAEFAHMARVIRHDLVPALSQLNPALAQFITAGAASARTAVFFGGTIGAVAIAGAILSTIIGKYISQAKEMTAATLDSSQALATLDAARAESGVRKLGEAFAEFNLTAKQAAGETGSVWQRAIAVTTQIVDEFTGRITIASAQLQEYYENLVKVQTQTVVPRAIADSVMRQGELLKKEGEAAKKTAQDLGELNAAWNTVAEGMKKVGQGEIEKLESERKEVRIRATQPAIDAQKTALERARKLREEADTIEGGIRSPLSPGGSIEFLASTALDPTLQGKSSQQKSYEQAAAKRVEANKLIEDSAKTVAAAQVAAGQKEQDVIRKISDAKARQASEAKQFSADQIQAFERLNAQLEDYVQQDLKRSHEQLTSRVTTAEAIASAEDTVLKLRREQLGLAESIGTLEDRLARSRTAALAPIEDEIKTTNALYESQKRKLEDLIKVGDDAITKKRELAALEQKHVTDMLVLQDKYNSAQAHQTAQSAQERRKQQEDEAAKEDQLLAHRVAMGQASMQEQMRDASARMSDPRRTVAEQRRAEEDLLSLRKQYADQYFRYYTQLGVSTWSQQLTSARSFLGETVQGSKEWFDAVSKIFGIYEQIYNQARGIAQQTAGIAAGEAQRAGKAKIGIRDIDQLVHRAQERDAAIFRGGKASPGDVTSAIGRMDLWKTMGRSSGGLVFGTEGGPFSDQTRTGLPGAGAGGPFGSRQNGVGSFGEAFATMQQTPQERLTAELSNVGKSMSSFGGSLATTQGALTDLAGAAAKAADALNRVGGKSANDVLTDEAEGNAPSSYRVLETAKGRLYTNVPPNVDSAMGRSLQLANRRGINSPETFP